MNQLIGLTSEEFQQLCSMIGMDKKPFHVMRFKKALENSSKARNLPLGRANSSCTLKTLVATNAGQAPSCIKKRIISSQAAARGPPPLLKTCPDHEQPDHQVPQTPTIQSIHPSYIHSNPSQSSLLLVHPTPVQMTYDPRLYTPTVGTWNTPNRGQCSTFYTDLGKRQTFPSNLQMSGESHHLLLQDPHTVMRGDQLVVMPTRTMNQESFVPPKDSSLVVQNHEITTSSSPVGRKRAHEPSTPVQITPTPVQISPTSSPITSASAHRNADYITSHHSSYLATLKDSQQPIKVKPSPLPHDSHLSKRMVCQHNYSNYPTQNRSSVVPREHSSTVSCCSPHRSSNDAIGINALKLSTQDSVRPSRKESDDQATYIQAKIEAKKAFQNLQLIAMEEARGKGDISTTVSLCELVKGLENELKELEKSYAQLTDVEKSSGEPSLRERSSANARLSVAAEASNIEHCPVRKRVKTNNHGSQGKSSSYKTRKRGKNSQKKPKQNSEQNSLDPSEAEIKDLMDNVSNATDVLHSLIKGNIMDW